MIRKLKRVVSLFCATLVFMACLATPVAADSEITDYSFYQFSSVASTFLSDAVARIGTGENESDLSIVNGTDAGGLLGYSDAADESGIIAGMLASALSYSSATYTYTGLFDLRSEAESEDSSDSDTSAQSFGLAFWEYAQYGKLLRQVGFDSTGSESSFVTKGIRWIGGNLLWLAYMALSIIGWFMDLMVGVLYVINPFRFVKPDTNDPTLSQQLQSSDIGYFEGSTTVGLSDFAALMGDIYRGIWLFAPVLIGIWLIVMVVGILMVPKGGVWPRLKQFLLRAFSLILGIPLLAVIYTECLGMVYHSDLFANPADAAGDTIASTLVDFENWSTKNYLRAPSSSNYLMQAEVTMVSGKFVELTPTAMTYSNLPQSALAINDVATSYSTTSSSESALEANAGVAQSLITRYSSSAQVTAGDFELLAKTSMSSTTLEALAEKAGSTVSKFRDNFSDIMSESGISGIFGNGGATLSTIDGSVYMSSVARGSIVDYSDATRLSTMSIYNYLSSRFDSTSMIVYSNEKASSGFVRESHYSVNLIGSGLTAFMYWFSALVEIGLIAMIGWLWCLGLIVNSFRRTLRMCMAIPGAMIGSLKSFAHMLVYIFMMFLEIIVTAFLFQALGGLIRGIKGIFSDMANGVIAMITGETWSNTIGGIDISEFMSSTSGATATTGLSGELATGLSGASVVLITQVIPTVGLIFFVFMLMRLRGQVLKSVDESLTKMISRMFGVDESAPTTGMPPAVSAGLGAGMGAAMGAKMSGGANGKSDGSSGKAIESGDAKGAVGDGGNGDASAEIADSGQASLEEGDAAGGDGGDGGGGDINISDNDTASAAFNGESNDEADAAEYGDTMHSLTGGDGSAGGGVESADSGVAGASLNDAASGEYEEGDVETTVESVGGESADDVQQDANEAAQEMGEQAADGSGQPSGSGQTGQTSGGVGAAKNGQSGQSQSGQQGTSGQGSAGKTGESGTGKDGSDAADSKDGRDGVSGTVDSGAAGKAAAAAAGVAGVGAVGAGAGGVAHASGQQSGVPSGTQSGTQSGSAAVSADKTDGVDGAGSGSDGVDGQAAQGELATADGKDGTVGAAVVPEGGASATLSDAYSRNAEARSRLAALEAQQGGASGTVGSAGGVSGTAGKAGVDSGSDGGQKSVGGTDGQKIAGGKTDGEKSSGAGAVAGATAVGGIAAGGVAAGTVGAARANNPAAVAAAAQGQKPVSGVSGQGSVQGQKADGGVSGQGSTQGQVSGSGSVGSIGGGREPSVGQVGAARNGGQPAAAVVAGAAVQGVVAPDGQTQGQVGGARQPAASVGVGQPSVAGVGAVASEQGSGQIGGARPAAVGDSRPDRMGPSAPMGPAVAGGAAVVPGGGAPGVPGGGRTTLSVEGGQGVGVAAAERRYADGSVIKGAAAAQVAHESRQLSQTGPHGSVSANESRMAAQSAARVVAVGPNGERSVTTEREAHAGSSYAVRITSDGGAPVIAPAAPAPGVSGNDGSGKGYFGPSYVEERSGSDTRTVRTTTTRTPAGKEAPSQKSVAGIAAQAAVAAMMANSNSPFMKAAGQVRLMGVAHEIYGGQLGEKGTGFVETTTEEVVEHHDSASRVQQNGRQLSVQEQIENLDADTAAIEARIRELEQQRAAQRRAKPRQLNEQTGSDDYA